MSEPRPRIRITFQLNGVKKELEVDPWATALGVIRDQLGLTGTKEGCGMGECGTCTIIVDGRAVNSCLMLAPKLDGAIVETVESLALHGGTHPIQQAFLETGAVQCGFCSPGMIMSTKALLDRTPRPSREQILRALSGNLCRCTGYHQIIEAVQRASRDYPASIPDTEAP